LTRLLVVEDDAAVRSTLVTFLELEGYAVDAAASTHEALQRLSETAYPIILSDIYLDERTGLDVLEAARQANPACAVILMTARGTMETVLSATTVATFLAGSSAFRFVESTVFLLAAMAVGIGLGAVFTGSPASLLSVVLILGLLVASHLPIGILGAALSMKTKLGDPVAQIFSWLTQLLSGILYPLNIVPLWLRPFTLFTPLTYSLDAARRCLINGDSLLQPAVYWNIVYLLLYVVISFPIALYAFKRSFESVRRDGELGHY